MLHQELIKAVRRAEAFVVVIDHDGEMTIEYKNDNYFFNLDDFNTRDQKVLRSAFDGTLQVDEG